MKNIINIVGIVLLIVLTSTVNQTIVSLSPTVPDKMIIKSFKIYDSNSSDVEIYIKEKVKLHWILKSVTAGPVIGTSSTWLVVLEKY
jgi:hypothetical protein